MFHRTKPPYKLLQALPEPNLQTHFRQLVHLLEHRLQQDKPRGYKNGLTDLNTGSVHLHRWCQFGAQ